MSTEFGDELLDAVAHALYAHDINGTVPARVWQEVNPLTHKNYMGFAQAALQAVYDAGRTDEQYVVCGSMPIEGHPDYKFCSTPYATLAEAEKCHDHWAERYGPEDPTFTIEHSARITLNTLRYWTQEDIDRIQAIAKKRAEEMAKYVK